ncbi:hypothetical protein M9H77_02800 [Catharanthus roseus]|uniref:Uncharacterized protein n=1 Tax=Catharanthus roseus TaxID=4058 RepID=A0ACC0C9L8_CATRO|nr:hypothetical protein M9H77_02800 [Catharanthus roseus]
MQGCSQETEGGGIIAGATRRQSIKRSPTIRTRRSLFTATRCWTNLLAAVSGWQTYLEVHPVGTVVPNPDVAIGPRATLSKPLESHLRRTRTTDDDGSFIPLKMGFYFSALRLRGPADGVLKDDGGPAYGVSKMVADGGVGL